MDAETLRKCTDPDGAIRRKDDQGPILGQGHALQHGPQGHGCDTEEGPRRRQNCGGDVRELVVIYVRAYLMGHLRRLAANPPKSP